MGSSEETRDEDGDRSGGGVEAGAGQAEGSMEGKVATGLDCVGWYRHACGESRMVV